MPSASTVHRLVQQDRYQQRGNMDGHLPVNQSHIFDRLHDDSERRLRLKATNGLANCLVSISNVVFRAHLARHSLPTREMAHGEPLCNQEVSKKNWQSLHSG